MGENICFQNISCLEYDEILRQQDMQLRYNAPMPYVGMYVAVASLVCCVTMVADMIHGFQNKKFWMPSKYFTINAASLTVLAVVVKLPMDLSMPMETSLDTLTKYSGSVFISTAMANFIPSLGTLNDKDLVQNLVALGILVLTLSGNLVIQFITSVSVSFTTSYGVFVLLELAQFVILAFSAIAISTTKKEIELAYDRLKKVVITRDEEQRVASFEFARLRKFVNVYWVIADTGSPKFVMSRAVTSSAAALICVVSVFYFVLLLLIHHLTSPFGFGSKSDYKWSVCFILTIQTIGIVIGSIAPALRSLFTVVCFCSETNIYDYRLMFKVETYWTARLKEWKHRPLLLNVRGHTYRKVIQILRNYFYTFCIIIQVIIVVESKILRFVSSLFIKPLLNWFRYLAVFIKLKLSNNSVGTGSVSETELEELKGFVLLLEGEVKLPQIFLKDICMSMDKVIKRGISQRPKKLLEFISMKNLEFYGLKKFDIEQFSLEQEPPRCWSLSLSNLASIAITLPTISEKDRTSFLQTVGEGISYARLIEKGLDTSKVVGKVGNAADILWNGVELNRKWLGTDLTRNTLNKHSSSKEVLEFFDAISTVLIHENYNSFIDDSDNWPVKLIIAYSMYRISNSLLFNKIDQNSTHEKVFNVIKSMVAEILISCLSNLPMLITSKCRCSSIEKRETSVKDSAHLLGATKGIIEFIQTLQRPSPAPEDAPYMDKWRAI